MSEKFDASWFDLSKYDDLVKLDLAGWENQLAVRQSLYDLIMNPRKFKSVDRKRVEMGDLIASGLSGIKKCPILQFGYEPNFISDTRLFIMNPLPSDTYLVSSVRLHDICSEAQGLPDILKTSISIYTSFPKNC